MRYGLLIFVLAMALPVAASDTRGDDEVVLQVVQRDLDRDGVEDRATLVRRGERHYLILEKGGFEGKNARQEIYIHPVNFPNPKIVYSEYARYLILGDSSVAKRGWVLWDRDHWGLLADFRTGVD